MEITFKKGFGITFVSVLDMGRLLLHFQGTFSVSQDGITYTLKKGEFGVTNEERAVLSQFLEREEREEFVERGQSIPTFDVTFERPVPSGKLESKQRFESWLSGQVPSALQAANQVMDASRGSSFEMTGNRSDEILRNIVEFNRRFKYPEFTRYLFYTASSGPHRVGFIGQGQTYTMQSLSGSEISQIQRRVNAPDKQVGFLLRAVEDYVDEDYGSSVLNSAVTCELAMHEFIRKRLRETHRVTNSQIDRFLEQTSNRLLLPVVLGYMTDVDVRLLDRCRALFELRNAIAHGKKQTVKKDEARNSFEDAESLLKTLRNLGFTSSASG